MKETENPATGEFFLIYNLYFNHLRTTHQNDISKTYLEDKDLLTGRLAGVI